MSDDPWYSWSHNPNAPKIDTFLHNAEKLTFVGFFFGAVLYGIRTSSHKRICPSVLTSSVSSS